MKGVLNVRCLESTARHEDGRCNPGACTPPGLRSGVDIEGHASYSRATDEFPDSCTVGRHWDVTITRSDFKSETSFGFLSPNYTL